ncbi:MAG: hypothetical protein MI923_09710 [Phycisphaerales bacterium]|nr:hypothetical protein [Phycisphaerales bacterium]
MSRTISSRTGPGRSSNSAEAAAKKQPPRSLLLSMKSAQDSRAEHSLDSPSALPSTAGRTAASKRWRAKSTTANCSSSFDPKWA